MVQRDGTVVINVLDSGSVGFVTYLVKVFFALAR